MDTGATRWSPCSFKTLPPLRAAKDGWCPKHDAEATPFQGVEVASPHRAPLICFAVVQQLGVCQQSCCADCCGPNRCDEPRWWGLWRGGWRAWYASRIAAGSGCLLTAQRDAPCWWRFSQRWRAGKRSLASSTCTFASSLFFASSLSSSGTADEGVSGRISRVVLRWRQGREEWASPRSPVRRLSRCIVRIPWSRARGLTVGGAWYAPVNLALGLYQQGYAVGLLDADIYGPSIPKMLNLADKQPLKEGVCARRAIERKQLLLGVLTRGGLRVGRRTAADSAGELRAEDDVHGQPHRPGGRHDLAGTHGASAS